MDARPTRRRVIRVCVLVIIVVCLSRENVWDIVYKVLIVSLHGVWEYLDAPLPTPAAILKPQALVKLVKDGLFELVKK